jgi:putative DNA primase/helicase
MTDTAHDDRFRPLTKDELASKPTVIADIGSSEDEVARIERARTVAKECAPIVGTPGEVYHSARGIDLTVWPRGVVGWHGNSGAVLFVARNAAGDITAVQRVFLNSDGTAKLKVDGRKNKLTNGALRGAAMTLPGQGTEALVCDGPEDALSLWQATGAHVRGCFGTIRGDVPLPADVGVILVGDNDNADRSGPSEETAAVLAKAAKKLRERGYVVKQTFPPAGIKDANDLLLERGAEAVQAMVAAAEPVEIGTDPAGAPDDDAAEIARLAALPTLAYERERETAAKRLGVRTSILDKLVRAEQGIDADPKGQGRRLILPDPEPWPVSVDGAALLSELMATVLRFIALPLHCAVAVALWVLHSHAIDASPITPRLAITSPEKRCGKSTLLRLLSALVSRALSTASITAPALFRTVEAARPTLLIDEADSFMADNEDMRGIINAGHARDGAVIRVVGEDFEPRAFSCWAPIAIATIGKLPGTIEDRSVMIAMRRRLPDEQVERLRLDRLDQFEPIRRRCARWVADNLTKLAEADPVVPAALNDRAADNWRPLLAIADTTGGRWPNLARRASAALSDVGENDDTSTRAMLLADIRALLADRGVDRVSSADLAEYLGTLEHRPWPEWQKGHPITARQIARLLAPFGIAPSSIRIGNATPKGYERKGFDDAFARYLPSDPQHRHNPSNPPLSGQNRSATEPPLLRIEKPLKPAERKACGGVADENLLLGNEAWETDL